MTNADNNSIMENMKGKTHMTHTKVSADEIVVSSPGDNDPRTSIAITIAGKVVAHVFVGQFSTSVSKGIFTKNVELEAKEITI